MCEHPVTICQSDGYKSNSHESNPLDDSTMPMQIIMTSPNVTLITCSVWMSVLVFVFKQMLHNSSVFGQTRLKLYCRRTLRCYSVCNETVKCTCQDSSVQQRRDPLMALGQFQTAEDLFVVIAWKIVKHHKTHPTNECNTSNLHHSDGVAQQKLSVLTFNIIWTTATLLCFWLFIQSLVNLVRHMPRVTGDKWILKYNAIQVQS